MQLQRRLAGRQAEQRVPELVVAKHAVLVAVRVPYDQTWQCQAPFTLNPPTSTFSRDPSRVWESITTLGIEVGSSLPSPKPEEL